MSRCRVLQTCGASLLAIVHIIWTRMQEVKGPIGSMSQKMASLFISTLPACIYGLYIQKLLALADDCILTSERIAETAFPPISRVFDQIDELACTAECLPRKFEDVLNKFPTIMHQVPFLEWALIHLIAWLKFLLSALSHWGSKTTREKEITVETGCNDRNNNKIIIAEESVNSNNNAYLQTHASSSSFEDVRSTSHISDSMPFLADTEKESFLISSPESPDISCVTDSSAAGGGKCSYKEILTKGVKEDAAVEDNMSIEPPRSSMISKDKEEIPKVDYENKGREAPSEEKIQKKTKGKTEKDQILRLFDASWSLS